MLGSGKLMAFVATANADEAQQFYEGVLGLRLMEDTPFALVFDVDGTMLRVAKVESVVAAPYTVLGWEVGNIRQTVRALTEAGVVFDRFEGLSQDELGMWASPDGASIAWFKDPDGNRLSLAQFGG